MRRDIRQFGEWLEEKMEKGDIERGKKYNRGYCSVCRRTHRRAWFRHRGQSEIFYLCWMDEPKIVERTSRDYVQYDVSSYLTKYPSNSPIKKKRPWYKAWIPRPTSIQISAAPPWIMV
jgi:hypothetical protein